MNLKSKIIVLLVLHTLCESAKILYIMPFTVKSHYISMKDLALVLAERGHDVYAITPFEEVKHPPNYRQIMIANTSMWSLLDEKVNTFDFQNLSFRELQNYGTLTANFICGLVFNSTAVQKLMKEDHKFDLVINEVFANEALSMFAHKYGAPLILVTTFGNSLRTNYFSRNPLQLSTVYHEYGITFDQFSFASRLRNFYYCMYDIFRVKFWYMPSQEEIVKKYFQGLQDPVPSLEVLAANASLVLMNSHFSIDTPTAYLPNFIEVAGLNHVKAKKPLPKDLQEILDNSKQGAVFLSFGSNVKSNDLGQNRLDAFLKVFGELKHTVLMKWENTSQPNVPKNVILREWFPQKDVLEHPNVKLFIGHGGYIGLQETIAAGVPVLGVPVYGDQFLNLVQAEEHGFGRLLPFSDISENYLRKIVNEMLTDKKYSEKAKEVSVRFKDRPMSGLDTAVWWIEYVIRHKGAHFMKTPALNMTFYEYHMLDVYLFIIVLITIPILVVYKLIMLLKKSLLKPKRIKKKRN